VKEKSLTSAFKFSYACGFAVELALPTASFPFLISSLAIERLWDAPDFPGSAGLFLLVPRGWKSSRFRWRLSAT
jgi:hypothetical protein